MPGRQRPPRRPGRPSDSRFSPAARRRRRCARRCARAVEDRELHVRRRSRQRGSGSARRPLAPSAIRSVLAVDLRPSIAHGRVVPLDSISLPSSPSLVLVWIACSTEANSTSCEVNFVGVHRRQRILVLQLRGQQLQERCRSSAARLWLESRAVLAAVGGDGTDRPWFVSGWRCAVRPRDRAGRATRRGRSEPRRERRDLVVLGAGAVAVLRGRHAPPLPPSRRREARGRPGRP